MKLVASIFNLAVFALSPTQPRVIAFFLPGHLPVKLPDYNSRLRVLVATYVTFSPNGTELLVNMGGEQVGPTPAR